MLLTARAELCPTIATIAPEEPARFNPECLEELCLKIGEVRAEAEVALALHRISEALPTLYATCRRSGREFVVALEHLCKDAELIGMATLARVAQDVLETFIAGNEVALAATMARLDRVGERSIHAVWDLEDLSG
ncbi:hypothetical protein K3728_00460 [Rhodobacteraceae bacterium M385]|nr:hypothetical protein K3728_00460 [Rhodobacteraceae bacterium M385]